MKSKLKWSQQEENLLKKLASNESNRKWVDIANQINELFPQKQRTSKQCREKYINHIQYDEGPGSSSWTKQDEKILFSEYRTKGPKWKIISKQLQGKSENAVKNKFYGKIRKLVRRLNTVCRQRINRSKKPLRDQSIMRIIDIREGFQNLPEHLVGDSIEIKNELLTLAQNQMEGYQNWSLVQQNNIVNLIKKVHKFNIDSRYYCSKKRKNSSHKKEPKEPKQIQSHQQSEKIHVQSPNDMKLNQYETYKILPFVLIQPERLNLNVQNTFNLTI